MRRVSVRDARRQISEFLDAAERGEETIIERRGRPTAKLGPVGPVAFVSRAEFRATLLPARTPSAVVVRALRIECPDR